MWNRFPMEQVPSCKITDRARRHSGSRAGRPQRGGSMSFTVHRRITAPLAVLAVAGLALAGCSTSDGGSSSGGPGDAGDADGVVTVYGTIQDTEAELLEQSWADWEKENNIDIQYEGSK